MNKINQTMHINISDLLCVGYEDNFCDRDLKK